MPARRQAGRANPTSTDQRLRATDRHSLAYKEKTRLAILMPGGRADSSLKDGRYKSEIIKAAGTSQEDFKRSDHSFYMLLFSFF